MIPCNLKCFIFLLLSCSVSALDLTLVPKSKGAPVVQACIAKISKAGLFSSDQQLLRRIAYVETHDGQDPNTYSGLHIDGGIWQLNQTKYEFTKDNVSDELLEDMETELDIAWLNTSFSDLRKPLYSALAARLYLELVLSSSIPLSTNVAGQASFWINDYTSSGHNISDFTNAIHYISINERELLYMLFVYSRFENAFFSLFF